MVAAAPRIDPRLRRAVRRLSRKRSSIADIHRSSGVYAGRLGLVRPSYEQIRIVVNEARVAHERRRATRELVLDVSFQTRPVSALEELLGE